jgi:hypothetical protein
MVDIMNILYINNVSIYSTIIICLWKYELHRLRIIILKVSFCNWPVLPVFIIFTRPLQDKCPCRIKVGKWWCIVYIEFKSMGDWFHFGIPDVDVHSSSPINQTIEIKILLYYVWNINFNILLNATFSAFF